jgi:hypothetical protein
MNTRTEDAETVRQVSRIVKRSEHKRTIDVLCMWHFSKTIFLLGRELTSMIFPWCCKYWMSAARGIPVVSMSDQPSAEIERTQNSREQPEASWF